MVIIPFLRNTARLFHNVDGPSDLKVCLHNPITAEDIKFAMSDSYLPENDEDAIFNGELAGRQS